MSLIPIVAIDRIIENKTLNPEIIKAAIDNFLPLSFKLFDLFKPMPPNIKPKSGTKNEQINPAIANPFVLSLVLWELFTIFFLN